jgi:HK97 family phage portal protein
LREALTRDAMLYRNGGFAFINRVSGRPVEFLRLDPEAMQVKVDPVTSEPLYFFAERGKQPRQYARENILHIPSPSLTGRGLVDDAKEAIGLALALEQHAARLFGRGARPSGILSIKGNTSADALTKMKASWQAAHGSANGGGTAVLPADVVWTALTLNSVDSQFLEMRAFAVAEIARHTRVPPIFLQDFGRATWSNSEQMGQQFLTYCLLPWVKRWEGEIRLKLFSPDERSEFFAEFMTDDLLRADIDSRMDAYSKAITARILNPNEARAAENRPPYAGGDKFENPNTSTGAA